MLSVYIYGENVTAVRIGTKRKLYTIPWISLKRAASTGDNIDNVNEECICCKKKLSSTEPHKNYCYFDDEKCSSPYSKGLLNESFVIGWVNEIYAVVVPHSLLINCAVCLNAEEQNRVALFQCGHSVCVDCLVMLITRDTCVVCKSVLASVQFLGCCAQPIEKTFNKCSASKSSVVTPVNDKAEASKETSNANLGESDGVFFGCASTEYVKYLRRQRLEWRKLVFEEHFAGSTSAKLRVNNETFLTSIVFDDSETRDTNVSSGFASSKGSYRNTLFSEKRQMHVDVVGVKWLQSSNEA